MTPDTLVPDAPISLPETPIPQSYSDAIRLWQGKPYHSLDIFLKNFFGQKVYKLALDGGFTCPNRDGRLDRRGCIFCSAGGSGDFAASRHKSIQAQIEEGKELLKNKNTGGRYIAYFQAYTNTYAPVSVLRSLYMQAVNHPEVAAISIATRPDCLPDAVLDLLDEINHIKPVWVELGLQTIHETTARYIRRGYPLSCFEQAVEKLRQINIDVIVHTILGLPGENADDMLATATYLAARNIQGIKPQLLHVLSGTDLAKDFEQKHFEVLNLETYTDILIRSIEVLPPDMIIHRITGDGPRQLLIEPKWSGHKKYVMNYIHQEFKRRLTWQGRNF